MQNASDNYTSWIQQGGHSKAKRGEMVQGCRNNQFGVKRNRRQTKRQTDREKDRDGEIDWEAKFGGVGKACVQNEGENNKELNIANHGI